MENKDWRERLNPFDAELQMMVESLTGKPCEQKNAGMGNYFIVVDYSKRTEPDFVNAVMDAIAGRLGERLVSIKDNPDASKCTVYIKLSKQVYPGIVRMPRNDEPGLTYGKVYCKRLGEIRAVQVKRDNPSVLFQFVGNGELELPEDGPAVYHFLNANMSVYAHAPENSYIVYIRQGLYKVVDETTFEKEYETK